MDSLLNLDCSKHSELYEALHSSIIRAVDRMTSTTKDGCIICGRYIEDYAHALLPFGYDRKHIHHNCAKEFEAYLSVELLDPPTRLDKDVFIASLGVNIPYSVMVEEGCYFISHLGEQIASQLVAKGFSTSQIVDLQLNLEKDHYAMQVVVYINAKIQHQCMFCTSGRRLVLPPNSINLWQETDMIPENSVMAREEGLMITADKKYVFHQSCLTEIINGLKRVTN